MICVGVVCVIAICFAQLSLECGYHIGPKLSRGFKLDFDRLAFSNDDGS